MAFQQGSLSGVVTLSIGERDKLASREFSSGRDCRVPSAHRRGAEAPVEPLHLALPPAGRLKAAVDEAIEECCGLARAAVPAPRRTEKFAEPERGTLPSII
jgi:hypothetical protein